MESVLEVLKRGEIILADGAFGTMLQGMGLPAGTLPEQWNVERPDAVMSVHAAYIEAGARYVTANTFGANRIRLRDAGLEDHLEEYNRTGVRLARQAAGDDAWVAVSIGPTGQLVEPLGPLSLADLDELYRQQLGTLADEGIDLVLVETMHDAQETCAAVRAAKEQGLPVFAQFAFNTKGRTMMGLRAADAAHRVEEAGADVVGANCGDGPEAVRVALEQMRSATTLPLLAKANAGLPHAGAHGEAEWDISPEEMAEHVRGYLDLGARVVGGCCGTTPEFIRAIGKVLAAYSAA